MPTGGDALESDLTLLTLCKHFKMGHSKSNKFNLLSVKLGFCSPEVLYSLFQNYCMSLYGCQLWDYSNESVLASVFVTWRKCVRNIFSIPYNKHCNLVHLIAQDSSVRVKLHKRYLKFFFNNASKSNNTLVSMMS